jgi:hypothetical protein
LENKYFIYKTEHNLFGTFGVCCLKMGENPNESQPTFCARDHCVRIPKGLSTRTKIWHGNHYMTTDP